MPVAGDGGWDYLRVDPDAHRLYVSRGTHMMVVDEVSGKVIGDIPDTMGIHGVALATDLGKGFTSNGGEATVTEFDLKTLKPLTKIKTTGMNPDSIIYDPMTKRVFTMNGRSSNSTVIDATNGQVVGTVDLGGKPEEPTLDGKGNMFVNLEDKSAIMEFDTKSLAVKGTWPLAPVRRAVRAGRGRGAPPAVRRLRQGSRSDQRRYRQGRGVAADRRRSGRRRLRPGHGHDLRHLPRGAALHHPRGLARQVHGGGQRHDAVRRAHHDAGPQDAPRVHGDGGLQGGRTGNAG